jgi:mRNA interferase HigB
MRVISVKKLRDFWQSPGNAEAEVPLRAWYRTVKHADWENFADVKATYGTADQVKKSRKVVFDIGGNKFRLIAVIDYERQKVFVRAVMDHKEYDRGRWKTDTFGEDWGKPAGGKERGQTKGRQPTPREK